LNPLVESNAVTFSVGNLKIVGPSAWSIVTSTMDFDIENEAIYAEIKCTNSIQNHHIGILVNPGTCNMQQPASSSSDFYGWRANGNKYLAGVSTTWGVQATSGDILQLWVKDGKLWVGVNDTVLEGGDPVAGSGELASGLTGQVVVAVCVHAETEEVNFGNPSFTITSGNTDGNGYGNFEYSPRAGFLALCTANLPDPAGAIEQSDRGCYINARTGTGSIATINDVPFDVSTGGLVIIKNLDQADEWKVIDSVRGATKEINFDSVNIESTDSNGITSLTSDGYVIGTGANGYNDSGENFLDIVLRKGPSYGLDIIPYTGTGSLRTISHNLGTAPSMIWVKNRDAGWQWRVYHKYSDDVPEDYGLILNDLDAKQDETIWNDTAPTSSVFTVNTQAWVNGNGNEMIAYAFADIPGYCKAFSYKGNGSLDGPYIPLGFRPSLLFIKRVDTGSTPWYLWNGQSSPVNPAGDYLHLEATDAEATNYGSFSFDLCSQGFKIRSAFGYVNGAGAGNLYVGFAWAEQPGKWSNAR